jgi:hypothetical protein
LDVLLYDVAIYLNLGFSREENMQQWMFKWAAKRLENEKALVFLD